MIAEFNHSEGWTMCTDRERRMALKYGLEVESYQGMEAFHAGCCGICGKTPDEPLHVDHCHHCDFVRGMLCRSCNTGLVAAYERLPEPMQDSQILNDYLARCVCYEFPNWDFTMPEAV